MQQRSSFTWINYKIISCVKCDVSWINFAIFFFIIAWFFKKSKIIATVIFALGYRRWLQVITHKAEKYIIYANRETCQRKREKQKLKNKTTYFNILNETVTNTIMASWLIQHSHCARGLGSYNAAVIPRH